MSYQREIEERRRRDAELARRSQQLRRQGRPRPSALEILARAEATVDRSGVVPIIEPHLRHGRGRPAEIGVKELLVGIAANAIQQREAVLTEVHRTLLTLRRDLGVTPSWSTVRLVRPDNRDYTYDQVNNCWNRMWKAIEQGIPDIDRVTGEVVGPELNTMRFCNRLLEASVPNDIELGHGAYSIDRTPFESWGARQAWANKNQVETLVDDHNDLYAEDIGITVMGPGFPRLGEADGRAQLSKDPDARDQYATGVNGQPSQLLLGYGLDIAVETADHDPRREIGDPTLHRMPLIVRAMTLSRGGESSAEAALRMVESLEERNIVVTEALADRAYTDAIDANYATPLRDKGIEVILDLKSTDHKVKRRYNGSTGPRNQRTPGVPIIQLDGWLYSSAILQTDLVKLPTFRVGMTLEQKKALCAEYDKRLPYAFLPVGQPDERGKQRWFGPARRHKVDCVNYPNDAPIHTACTEEESCSCGATITVPPDWLAKHRQRYPWGTSAWAADYSRRSAVESFFALLDVHDQQVQRSYTKVFGLTPNSILIAFALAAINIKRADEWRLLHELDDPWVMDERDEDAA